MYLYRIRLNQAREIDIELSSCANILIAISGGLEIIPRSLRVLHFSNQHEEPWKRMMPALNVLTSDHDSLSPGLRHLSLSLCEIKIENVSLAPDFLYPLDSDGYPLPDSASLHWPRLKKLELHAPPFLPSGML